MRMWVKRWIDLAGAVLALVILAPIMAVVALAIRLTMGPPVLFRQARAGYKGRPFLLHKFRVMRDAYDENGRLLPDAKRLTRLGRFLRYTSLDELPQLWNVLRGDMALVGPRPFLVEYLELYDPEQHRRHDVRPGITGWAQVNGRNLLPWQEKFKLDVWYVDHWSLRLDLYIMLKTLWVILRRTGINHHGQATTENFKGNESVVAG